MQHSYLSKFLKNTACIAMMALAACALPACSDNDEPEPVIQPTASGLFTWCSPSLPTPMLRKAASRPA